MHSFTKIALQKIAEGEDEIVGGLVGSELNEAEQLAHDKGLLGSTGDWLKGKYHALKDAITGGTEKAVQLAKDHPNAAVAAAAAGVGGKVGATLWGLHTLKKARGTTNRAISGLEEAASKIHALKGANKKLGLLAAIGIPGSAAATYFATRDSGKKKRK